MKLFAGLQWRHRHREQTYGHGRREGRRGWKEWRDYHGNIHITTCKIDVQWEFAVWLRELKPRLCNNLEGWEGWEVRGRSRGRGHMSTYDWLMLMYGRNIVMQYYKAMLLQLKMSKFKSEKKTKNKNHLSYEGGGRGHMYTYDWFMLMYGRNHHNIVIILQLNIKLKNHILCLRVVYGLKQ